MRSIFLILKNSFKNTFKNKAQLLGLTLLVTLLAVVLSLMTALNARVIEQHESLKKSSNQHNIILNLNPRDSVPAGEDENSNIPVNQIEAQQHWVYTLEENYFNRNDVLDFDWSRTEMREFTQVIHNDEQMTLRAVAKTTSKKSEAVDKLIISNGHDIESNRQAVIDATFAEKNNIEIGDIIRFQNDILGDQMLVASRENTNTSEAQFQQIESMLEEGLDDPAGIYQKVYKQFDWYQVVGFGNSADLTMPIINANSPMPNRKKEGLIYVDPSALGLFQREDSKGLYYYDATKTKLLVSSTSEMESYYSLKTKNGEIPSDADMARINEDFKKMLNKQDISTKLFFAIGDADYALSGRTQNLEDVIITYELIAAVILLSLLVVSLYTAGIMTRKQIEKTRGQIGTMRALGYRKRKLILSYVMTPVFTAIVGGISGYAIAQAIQFAIVDMFKSYFSIDMQAWRFDTWGFLAAIILMWFVLSAITFLIAYLILKGNTLELLSANKKMKISKFGMWVKSHKVRNSFDSKMRTALLLGASGKMFGVGIVVFGATIMMTVAYSAPNIMNINKIKSYTGIKYKQVVEYNEPSYNNPYSFLKTFNSDLKNPEGDIYKRSDKHKFVTALPMDEKGDYDYKYILDAYLNNNIQNEFYSIKLTQNDPDHMDSWEMMLSNMKVLNSYSKTLTVDYFRYMSSLAIAGNPFGWAMLKQQWPDLVTLLLSMEKPVIPGNANPNEEEILRYQFKLLQNFYNVYSTTIGMSITRDFISPEIKPNASKEEKINSFNENPEIAEIAFNEFMENENGWNSPTIQKLKWEDDYKFKLTPGQDATQGSILPAFKILDGEMNTLESETDFFSEVNIDEVDIETVEKYMVYLLTWYGTLYSQRIDQAIVQAGYSRAAYFMKQSMKEAFEEGKPFTESFGITPFNKELEQLGNKINVQDANGNEFKIYGIENTHQFLDLESKKGDDLIEKLFTSEEENAIVINQSIAKKLKLSVGDEVDLDVIQREMQDSTDKNNASAIKLENWSGGPGEVSSDQDFIQYTDMDTNSIAVKNNHGKTLRIKPLVDLGSSPGPLYDSVLKGDTKVGNNVHNEKFKVIGVHDGYGTLQAWIKNDDAKEILSYNDVQDFFWEKQFVKQFGHIFEKKEFSKDSNTFIGKKNDITKMTYDEFKRDMINNEDEEIALAAKNIDIIFNNAYPIFNYKYSNKDDVGDLSNSFSIYQKFGDYTPLGLNGTVTDKRIYDGIGEGAMSTIVPIQISKEMLNQMSDIVNALLFLLIAMIIVITFVIILLTTSLIISDNTRFIATMKVLGYSDRYISKNVLGMYLIVIVITFILGLFCGGGSLYGIIAIMTQYSSMVLPLALPIWLIPSVALSVVGIYLITIIVGYRSIAKLDATLTLKDGDI
ncbi:FtsX-like permease family protein [Mesoplasma photuris]|uniref:FtsX-like permease family protein n=1 Tax=Mesoplasma photuris TaxID=217731 RepID=UPI0004E0CCA2|nr:FtsX-like permease family protein [Mesoplasma photuris]